MANKFVAVFLMCLVVVAAAAHMGMAHDHEDVYTDCFKACHEKCKTEGSGSTYCEMKCDAECLVHEADAKMKAAHHAAKLKAAHHA